MNMSKEYQAELKQLRKNERKVQADKAAASKAMKRRVREHKAGMKRADKELARIAKRAAILRGRLS